VRDGEVAYIGDDLPDLPLIRRVGLGVAVANAREEVKDKADFVTSRDGGSGAIREVIELILTAQGIWPQILERYGAE
jgi:3-deoxy-D-manno-octulosonate 8-phosphate phosphatase (KDO 8-P phosphatase)